MFPRDMIRALAPYLPVALLVVIVAAVAYDRGAPAWIAHAAILLAGLVFLLGYDRWDRREHPR